MKDENENNAERSRMERYQCKEQLCQGHIVPVPEWERDPVPLCPPELTLCTEDTCSSLALCSAGRLCPCEELQAGTPASL